MVGVEPSFPAWENVCTDTSSTGFANGLAMSAVCSVQSAATCPRVIVRVRSRASLSTYQRKWFSTLGSDLASAPTLTVPSGRCIGSGLTLIARSSTISSMSPSAKSSLNHAACVKSVSSTASRSNGFPKSVVPACPVARKARATFKTPGTPRTSSTISFVIGLRGMSLRSDPVK